MNRKTRKALARLLAGASLLLCLPALGVPALAGTLGSQGTIGEVDLVNRTVEVGRYLLEVTPTSVILDAEGERIQLEQLEAIGGEAGFTMTRFGTGYRLRTLQVYDDELDGENG